MDTKILVLQLDQSNTLTPHSQHAEFTINRNSRPLICDAQPTYARLKHAAFPFHSIDICKFIKF